jgi:asparagine synthase (glutamine-hydrolysing)
MCGIVGIVNLQRRVEESTLNQLAQAIEHRGPNHTANFIEHTDRLSVGLSYRRLSIIDLSSAGNQPMANETNEIWTVYNGEIYNHNAIRHELASKGHTYHSLTDTESVVHAYEEYGLDCLRHFNGMFAFALYDRSKQRVLLARDRTGIKPLYYVWDGTQLTFASELKALLACGAAPRELDPQGLDLYLSFGYVPAPYSICKGVRKLEAGTYLLLENGQIRIGRFWDEQFITDQAIVTDMSALVEQTRILLTRAVERQLMSDVPVGALLSGGLDSTIVVALAQQLRGSPLDTFTVSFAGHAVDSAFNDDARHARSVAESLGTRHHEISIDTTMLPDMLPGLVGALDEPIYEPAFVSTAFMCKLARENGVPVVLTGDGSDELFSGYSRYRAADRLDFYEQIPFMGSAMSMVGALLPRGATKQTAKSIQHMLGASDAVKFRTFSDIFAKHEKRRLIGTQSNYDIANDVIAPVMARIQSSKFADRMAMADFVFWVGEHFNPRLDKMSMAHSVEARVPFQDNDVVDFALGLSVVNKTQNKVFKSLLREAFGPIIPKVVLERQKRPFQAPGASWLNDGLRPLLLDTFAANRSRWGSVLDQSELTRVISAPEVGTHNAFKIWTLFVLQLWCNEYISA